MAVALIDERDVQPQLAVVVEGEFADEGLDVELKFFQAAQPIAVAIASGDIDFGVTLLPGKEAGQSASFAGGDTIAVTNNAEDVDGAWAFIEWLLSDEVQLEVYAKNGAFTSRTDLADNIRRLEDYADSTGTR